MTFQLLISTMYKTKDEILEMLTKMNIHCDCIVINQCNENYTVEFLHESRNVKAIFTTERGLSKSRNLALKSSSADVIGFADDDLYYYDNIEETVLSYYGANSKADVVLFAVDSYRHKCSDKEKRCSFFELGSYMSVQTTVKRLSVINKKIGFNELFGTGSGHFNSGEENIFLSDCYKHKLKIYYSPLKILKHDPAESTWFKGFNDPKYTFDRGAIYCAISSGLSPLYYLRFLVTKRKLIKPITLWKAFMLLLQGRNEYRRAKGTV